MDIIQKLNEIQDELTPEQEEEQKVVNDLMFLLFGREPKELPKKFQVNCLMENEALETFLREKLELDVKEVSFDPISLLFGNPSFIIKLN